MTALAVINPYQTFFDLEGDPLDNGRVYFGMVDSDPRTSPKAVFWDKATFQPVSQPARTKNGFIYNAGRPSLVYIDGDFSMLVLDKRGRTVLYVANSSDYVIDVLGQLDDASGSSLVGYNLGAFSSTNRTVQDRLRDAESVFDYLTDIQKAAIRAETGGATAECSLDFQDALDDTVSGYVRMVTGRYMLARTLRVKSGTKRVTLQGGSRIRTLLSPSLTDVQQPPQNVNALIMVQDNNAHLCLEALRFFSNVAYTGVGVYAKEGGGSDGSGQALFSALLRNLWLDFASNNNGWFVGGLQNSVVQTITAENMKSVFRLEGAANADVSFTDIKAYNCFDPVIDQTADTFGSALMTVNDVHLYTHNRGPAISVQNWVESAINGVIYEAAIGNLGNTGLFKFKDCQNLVVTNSMAVTRTGVALCSIGVDIESSAGITTSIKFKGVRINADVGLRLRGPGAFDLSFEDCDFTNCTTACWQVLTNCSGVVRTRGCRFSDSQGSIVLHTVANALAWYSYNDECLNAGLGGGAGTWNLALATSAEVYIEGMLLGRTNGAAAASTFVSKTGSGSFTMRGTRWMGTPPVARFAGAQPVNQIYGQASSTAPIAPGTPAYTVDIGDLVITVSRIAGSSTLTLPSPAAQPGRVLYILNFGTQTIISASANVVPVAGPVATPGTAICAAGAGKFAHLVSDGTYWQVVTSN